MTRRDVAQALVVAVAAWASGAAIAWRISGDHRVDVPNHHLDGHHEENSQHPANPWVQTPLQQIPVASGCETSLKRCATALKAGQQLYDAWAEQIEGKPIEWTPTMRQVAGEDAVRAMIAACPGFETMSVDCDEYPCMIASRRGDLPPCLTQGMALGSFGYVGAGEDKLRWWSIVVERGPKPDARRQRRRGLALVDP